MKVAIYSNIIDCGGISKFIYNLNNAFINKKIESKIVTFSVDTVYGNHINILNCSNHIERIRELSKFIKYNDITVIISNTWFETLIARFSTLISRRKIKIISVVHIRPSLWGISEKDIIKSLAAKLSYKMCDNVVAVSNELKEALINKKWVCSKKICTIYNPVVLSEINKEENKIIFKDIENEKSIQIAVIGWIQPRKAQDIIIKALNEINEKRIVINFIGGIEDKEYNCEILNLIKEFNLDNQVKFWGVRKDVLKILDKMDILISCSRGEALPTVLIEGLFKQVPIISSDCEYGPKEILDNGIYGELFNTDDYKELSYKLIELINDNDKYNNYKKLSKERSRLFTVDRSVKQYLEILK